MSTKFALILTGIWTILVIGACSGGIWFVTTQVPRHQQDERAKMLGGATGVVALIGYSAIFLPWAVVWSRKRREAAEKEAAARDDASPRRKQKGGAKRER